MPVQDFRNFGPRGTTEFPVCRGLCHHLLLARNFIESKHNYIETPGSGPRPQPRDKKSRGKIHPALLRSTQLALTLPEKFFHPCQTGYSHPEKDNGCRFRRLNEICFRTSKTTHCRNEKKRNEGNHPQNHLESCFFHFILLLKAAFSVFQ